MIRCVEQDNLFNTLKHLVKSTCLVTFKKETINKLTPVNYFTYLKVRLKLFKFNLLQKSTNSIEVCICMYEYMYMPPTLPK